MSNMIKRAFVKVEDTEKLVIDSNGLVTDKMEKIAKQTFVPLEQGSGYEEGYDEFTEGLVADKVEMLVGDPAGEGEDAEALAPSNVIRNDAAASQAAEEILSNAQAEAGNIVSEAENQAQSIISDAQGQAQGIRDEARNEGFNAGHDEGYQAGMAEAEALKSQYEEMIVALEEDYRKKMEDLEPMFVDTLTGIYEHIFHVDLSNSKDIVFYLIQNALRNAEGGEGFIVHVSKEDYGYVSMQKKELLQGITGGDGIEIVEDMTLKNNECLIETGGGIFDCSLETELAGLKRELMLLSYEKSTPGAEENG